MKRKIGYLGAFISCAILSLSIGGCASGGYKLTRQYARWVNSQNLILRIIIYLLTGIVFAVTLLIDAVVFNTMDFWNGTVSQGTFEFSGEGKNYVAKHELQPGTTLKKSTIQVMDNHKSLLQTVILNEVAGGKIELYIDGKLRGMVNNIDSIPYVSHYNTKGELTKEIAFFSEALTLNNKYLAAIK